MIAAYLLAGCIEINTSIAVRRPDDLRVTMVYQFSEELFKIGVFDDDAEVRALPLTRRDAEITASLHPELSLTRYRTQVRDDVREIVVEYRARSAAALAHLTKSASSQGALLDWEKRELRWLVAAQADSGRSDQTELITALFAGLEAQFRLEMPAVPTVSGSLAEFAQVSSRRVEVTVPMVALALPPRDQTILIRW